MTRVVPDASDELLARPWLRGSSALSFRKKFDDLRTQMTGEIGPVVVADADPVDFLAAFFAALLSDRPVVLGSDTWGRQEWNRTSEIAGAPLDAGNIFIPTGGTSGQFRFARHSWKTLAASAEGFRVFFEAETVKSICVLPLFHVSGLIQAVRAIASGGELVLFDWSELEAGNAPPSAEDYFLSLVPTQLRRLLAVEALHPWLRNLKAIMLGGAAAPADLLDTAARLCLPLALSYGATETAAMATAQTPEEFLGGARTSGRALPHVSVRIAGPDGEDLPPGTEGAIRVAGSSLFHGYVPGGPRQEREWVAGDRGRLDRDGRLTVLGRTDRMVVTGGENVSPEEVEGVLLASGLVDDVWVFGVEDPKWGQAVSAAYVPSKGATVDDLRAAVRKELASFKVPKFWLPVTEIPRTKHGKIDRPRLKAMGKNPRGKPRGI